MRRKVERPNNDFDAQDNMHQRSTAEQDDFIRRCYAQHVDHHRIAPPAPVSVLQNLVQTEAQLKNLEIEVISSISSLKDVFTVNFSELGSGKGVRGLGDEVRRTLTQDLLQRLLNEPRGDLLERGDNKAGSFQIDRVTSTATVFRCN